MPFAENLKHLRKENGLSQEQLAEIMEVSRQAVSKWEQGESYPEAEKLLLLAQRFHISLDSLMDTAPAAEKEPMAAGVTGRILITSPHENTVVTCSKIRSSQPYKGGKNAPQYSLFGVNDSGNAFWGEPTTFLGWYADQASIAKEIRQIQQALAQGQPTYELQYSVKTERKWLRISMVKD